LLNEGHFETSKRNAKRNARFTQKNLQILQKNGAGKKIQVTFVPRKLVKKLLIFAKLIKTSEILRKWMIC